jgi:hypothetical protein
MALTSIVLAYFVAPWWLLLTAFVGVNMLQAAFTGFCPAAIAFKRLGLPIGEANEYRPHDAALPEPMGSYSRHARRDLASQITRTFDRKP